MNFQFLLGCFYCFFTRFRQAYSNFQFLLGCFAWNRVSYPRTYFSAFNSFQDASYRVYSDGQCNFNFQLSIPSRMLHSAEYGEVYLSNSNFQFLLGCFKSVLNFGNPQAGQQAFNSFQDASVRESDLSVVKSHLLSIPSRMLR